MATKKLRIGWFSFTCSEDSTMVWIELMNQNLPLWKDILEIKHARALKSQNTLKDIDVAFVEGAITTEHDARKLRSIRKNAKRLVAVGSCAVSAMPAGQRNNFDDVTKKEIEVLIKKFKHTDRVRALKEIVAVDDELPGCPMDEGAFMAILEKYLKEFGVTHA